MGPFVLAGPPRIPREEAQESGKEDARRRVIASYETNRTEEEDAGRAGIVYSTIPAARDVQPSFPSPVPRVPLTGPTLLIGGVPLDGGNERRRRKVNASSPHCIGTSLEKGRG